MGQPWAGNMVMWYCSADTLFWQLSIDHNMYVQYQVASHTSQIDSVPFHHIVWPLVWTDRQMYGHITTKKISRMDR